MDAQDQAEIFRLILTQTPRNPLAE
jgi:hypothetical protein